MGQLQTRNPLDDLEDVSPLDALEDAQPKKPRPKGVDEDAFRAWYKPRAEKWGLSPDPDDPKHFYDYRAAYENGAEPGDDGHWPSEFKKEGHPNLYVDGRDTRTGRGVTKETRAQDLLSDLQKRMDPKNGRNLLSSIPALDVAGQKLANMIDNGGHPVTESPKFELPKTAEEAAHLTMGLTGLPAIWEGMKAVPDIVRNLLSADPAVQAATMRGGFAGLVEGAGKITPTDAITLGAGARARLNGGMRLKNHPGVPPEPPAASSPGSAVTAEAPAAPGRPSAVLRRPDGTAVKFQEMNPVDGQLSTDKNTHTPTEQVQPPTNEAYKDAVKDAKQGVPAEPLPLMDRPSIDEMVEEARRPPTPEEGPLQQALKKTNAGGNQLSPLEEKPPAPIVRGVSTEFVGPRELGKPNPIMRRLPAPEPGIVTMPDGRKMKFVDATKVADASTDQWRTSAPDTLDLKAGDPALDIPAAKKRSWENFGGDAMVALREAAKAAEEAAQPDGGKPRAEKTNPSRLSQKKKLSEAATAEEHEALVYNKIARAEAETRAPRNPILETMAAQMDHNKVELGAADKTGPIIAESLAGPNKTMTQTSPLDAPVTKVKGKKRGTAALERDLKATGWESAEPSELREMQASGDKEMMAAATAEIARRKAMLMKGAINPEVTAKPKIDLKEAAHADIAEGVDDIIKALKGKSFSGIPLDPQIIAGMGKIVKGVVKRGYHEVNEAWTEIARLLGPSAANARAAFDHVWKMEATEQPQPEVRKMPSLRNRTSASSKDNAFGAVGPKVIAKSSGDIPGRVQKTPPPDAVSTAAADGFDVLRLSNKELSRVAVVQKELSPAVRKAVQQGTPIPKISTEELELAWEYRDLYDKAMGRERPKAAPEPEPVVTKPKEVEQPSTSASAEQAAPAASSPPEAVKVADPDAPTVKFDQYGKVKSVEGLNTRETDAFRQYDKLLHVDVKDAAKKGRLDKLTNLNLERRNQAKEYQRLWEKAADNKAKNIAPVDEAVATETPRKVMTMLEEKAAAAAEQRPTPQNAAIDKVVADIVETVKPKPEPVAEKPEPIKLPPIVVEAQKHIAVEPKEIKVPHEAQDWINKTNLYIKAIEAAFEGREGIIPMQEHEVRAAAILKRMEVERQGVKLLNQLRNKEINKLAGGPAVKTSEMFAEKVALPKREAPAHTPKEMDAAVSEVLQAETPADRRIRQEIEDTAIESMLERRREKTKGDEYWERRGGRPTEGEKKLMGKRFLTEPGEVIRAADPRAIGEPPPGTDARTWRSLQAVAIEAKRLIKDHDIYDPRLIGRLREFYGAAPTAEMLGLKGKDRVNMVRELSGGKTGRKPLKSVVESTLAENDKRLKFLLDNPKGFIRTELTLAAAGGVAGGLYGATLDGESPMDVLANTLTYAALGGLSGAGAGAALDRKAGLKPLKNGPVTTQAKAHVETLDTADLLLGPANYKASFGMLGSVATAIWEQYQKGNPKKAAAMAKYITTEAPAVYFKIAIGPAAGALVGGAIGKAADGEDGVMPGIMTGIAAGTLGRLTIGKGPLTSKASAQLGSFSTPHKVVPGMSQKILDEVLRPFKAADHVGMEALKRGGISEPEALRLMGNGEPTSNMGQAALNLINSSFALRMLAKFPRVRINMLERGIEYMPGLQNINTRSAHGAEQLTNRGRRAKMQIGAAAFAAGMAYDYIREPGVKEAAVISTAAGPAFIPWALGMAARRGAAKSGLAGAAQEIGTELVDSLPQVNEMSIRTLPSRFKPLRPLLRGFETDKRQ